ncbi:hypothetical protein AB0C06_15500 [Micromonospora inaquosa]|uniref:hypothetical protein n=1 Tax=Micromonospora inaquosa TaxID=2203716 RepID=UPI0013155CEB|nr:hypothetical protein [Micromonospora inaquosa]
MNSANVRGCRPTVRSTWSLVKPPHPENLGRPLVETGLEQASLPAGGQDTEG